MFLEDRPQADRFRQKLLNACFKANHAQQTGNPEARVRVSIVGGGATGVELAAELYNAAKSLRNYGLEVFDETTLEVSLLEAGPRILPALDDTLAATAKHELEMLGVKVLDRTQVVRLEDRAVHIGDGSVIEADLIVWAAGVKGADEIKLMSDLALTRGNQIVVRPTLQTETDDRIFALGDCASCMLPGRDRPIPPRAQSAHQMASLVFTNLSDSHLKHNYHPSCTSISLHPTSVTHPITSPILLPQPRRVCRPALRPGRHSPSSPTQCARQRWHRGPRVEGPTMRRAPTG